MFYNLYYSNKYMMPIIMTAGMYHTNGFGLVPEWIPWGSGQYLHQLYDKTYHNSVEMVWINKNTTTYGGPDYKDWKNFTVVQYYESDSWWYKPWLINIRTAFQYFVGIWFIA